MVDDDVLQQAATVLHQGGLIAYPTEAVYGLGCDPFNRNAVERLCALKQRSLKQGLLLIAANFAQVERLIAPLPQAALDRAKATWPGPHTWVFPRSAEVPDWISGEHSGIALRVSAHPIAVALCEQFGGALVSTSANRHGTPPALSAAEVAAGFGNSINLIVEGALGGLGQPTPIRDALSGAVIRA